MVLIVLFILLQKLSSLEIPASGDDLTNLASVVHEESVLSPASGYTASF